MKLKTFIILLIVLVVLGAGAWLTGVRKSAPPDSRMGEKLFVDLEPNRIEAITIRGAEQTVQLAKQEVWEVRDRYGYPADFDKITDMVRRLAAAKIGSSFEATPDTIKNLGLIDPTVGFAPEASGLRIVFNDAAGQTLLDVILGHAREAAAGTGGHYLLPAGTSSGYMVDQNFLFIGRRPTDWLNRHLLDIRPEDIERVICTDPQTKQARYILKRPEPYADPVWTDAASGDTLQPARFDAVFRALIALSMDDVTVATSELEDRTFAGQPFLTYYLYDGTRYVIFPGSSVPEEPDLYFLRIEVEWHPPAERDLSDTETDVATEESTLRQQAEELTRRLRPWVFMLPEWKYKNFVLDTTEFVQASENTAG